MNQGLFQNNLILHFLAKGSEECPNGSNSVQLISTMMGVFKNEAFLLLNFNMFTEKNFQFFDLRCPTMKDFMWL